METLTTCNLCGGRDFELFAERRGNLTSHTFTIVRCTSCSLVFTNPRLDDAENAALYEEDYFRGEGFDTSVKYLRLDEEALARRDESLAIVAKLQLSLAKVFVGQELLCETLDRCLAVSQFLLDAAPVWLDEV